MKFFTLTIATFCAFCAVSLAGPEQLSSGKEMKQVAIEPSCDWYRSNEWDISIWGAVGFPADSGRGDIAAIGAAHERNQGGDNHELNIGELSNDRFLNTDSAFGAGVDIKYFCCKYIGIGVEGYFLDAANTVGGALGTVTVRLPIGCSRWAPYVFAGAGMASGGSHDVVAEIDARIESNFARQVDTNDTLFDGQIGGGLEYRLTKHIGMMADFSWNILDGPRNNFGMVRSGINFGF